MKKLTKKVLNAYLKKMGEKVLDISISDDKQSAICTTYRGMCAEWFFYIPTETVEKQCMSTTMVHEPHLIEHGWTVLENTMREI